MRRLLVALSIVASLFTVAEAEPVAAQDSPYILLGLFPGEPGLGGGNAVPRFDGQHMDAFRAWTGRTPAVTLFFANHWDTTISAQISSRKSIAQWSWAVLEPYAGIAAGTYDSLLLADIAAVRLFVQGPNLLLGDGDDRRVQIRLGYEANLGIDWSPCVRGETPAQFIAAWRHVVDLYRSAGLDSTRVAFIFSMGHHDGAGACTAAALYPGDAYVDWTGVDGYAGHGGTDGFTPDQVFGPMVANLRTIAPTKPVAITELGVRPNGFDKYPWITDAYEWARTHDIRMVSYFNVDREQAWGAFGGEYNGADDPPNELYNHCPLPVLNLCLLPPVPYRGYSTFRQAVQQPIMVPANGTTRTVTDQQFLGQ